jgi:hypothetical protein
MIILIKEIIQLDEEKQKLQREGIDKGRNVFNKSRVLINKLAVEK